MKALNPGGLAASLCSCDDGQAKSTSRPRFGGEAPQGASRMRPSKDSPLPVIPCGTMCQVSFVLFYKVRSSGVIADRACDMTMQVCVLFQSVSALVVIVAAQVLHELLCALTGVWRTCHQAVAICLRTLLLKAWLCTDTHARLAAPDIQSASHMGRVATWHGRTNPGLGGRGGGGRRECECECECERTLSLRRRSSWCRSWSNDPSSLILVRDCFGFSG